MRVLRRQSPGQFSHTAIIRGSFHGGGSRRTTPNRVTADLLVWPAKDSRPTGLRSHGRSLRSGKDIRARGHLVQPHRRQVGLPGVGRFERPRRRPLSFRVAVGYAQPGKAAGSFGRRTRPAGQAASAAATGRLAPAPRLPQAPLAIFCLPVAESRIDFGATLSPRDEAGPAIKHLVCTTPALNKGCASCVLACRIAPPVIFCSP